MQLGKGEGQNYSLSKMLTLQRNIAQANRAYINWDLGHA